MTHPTPWLPARPEDRTLRTVLSAPRWRLGDRVLQAQRPAFELLYPAFMFGWAALAFVVDADRTWVVLSVVVAVLAALLLWRVVRRWTVIDAAGWHGPDGLIPREQIDEIVLFRGDDPQPDFLRTSDGRRIPLADMVPSPFTRGMTVPSDAFDVLCLLQHDLAHELGWAPIPVQVDLGAALPAARFPHTCARCEVHGSTP